MHAARSAIGPRDVGQPRVRPRGAPQAGEALVDHAVAAAAGHRRPAHDAAPRPEPLLDPARLAAEQLGLPARVGQLGLR